MLIVDDESGLRRFLGKELTLRGMTVQAVASGEEAVELVRNESFHVVLMDVRMPGMGGLEALKEMRRTQPGPAILMLTAEGTVDSAVEAMRCGAFHYLTKPFHLDGLEAHVRKARDQVELERRARAFQRILERNPIELIGESAALDHVREMIRRVAPADTSVVVEGESGTGKELIAHALHSGSPRADKPFVTINCGALPESLLESELFGHEKGAFTGAAQMREGLTEAAHGGTLFLDEVGELALPLQSRLLRFLESGEVRRVGSNRTRTVDVRVVAATNRDLHELVAEGLFREDLYYRLHVFAIKAPPLRDRAGDVALLLGHFLGTVRGPWRGPFQVDPDVVEALKRHRWPGNIRELRNAVERMMLLADDGHISSFCLPPEIMGTAAPTSGAADELNLAALERQTIERALRECDDSKRAAAARLGISVRTLYYRVSQYSGSDEGVADREGEDA